MTTKNDPQAQSLALSAPHILAEALRLPELTGFIEKRYVAPPDHAAILIRDGAIVDTFTGANVSVGGVLAKLKSLFTGKHHVRVVLADLRPFSLQAPFKALSRDSVEIAATATFELQVDPERATNAMGLIGPTDKVGRADVLERFRPHLVDRVVQASVGRVDAADLRGDVGLQDKVQADVMREIERVAGDLGLIVRAVSLEWAVNAVEREAMDRARIDREQSMLDESLEDLKRGIERSKDATSAELTSTVDVAKLEMASEDELVRMALDQEIALVDTREETARRRELEALRHEVQVLGEERAARFENQLAEAGQAIDVAKKQRELTVLHREIDALNAASALELQELAARTNRTIAKEDALATDEVVRATNSTSRDHVAGLQDIELSGEERRMQMQLHAQRQAHEQEMARLKAEQEANLAQLKVGATMTPEQTLAVNAGLSSDVAAVLAEQARAQAGGGETAMQLMREMVTQATDARIASETQAREMFQSAMDGAVGVAHGAGGAAAAPAARPSAPSTVECPQCGRENDLGNKHCIGCGHRLRA